METVELNYKKLGNGPTNLIILHGLFGSLDNWMTLGKKIAERHTVWLVDQRNHGRSPHDPVWDYSSMAHDLQAFIHQHGIKDPVLLGHSMGGKTVMKFANLFPKLAKGLLIIDMAPRFYNPHHQVIIKAFEAVHVEKIQSRTEAEERMMTIVQEDSIRLFLLKNLGRDSNGYFWKHNFKVIKANIENIGEATFPDKEIAIPTLFVRGEKSDYVNMEDFKEARKWFTKANLETISGAGHWIHAERPTILLEVISTFLENVNN